VPLTGDFFGGEYKWRMRGSEAHHTTSMEGARRPASILGTYLGTLMVTGWCGSHSAVDWPNLAIQFKGSLSFKPNLPLLSASTFSQNFKGLKRNASLHTRRSLFGFCNVVCTF